MSRNHAGSGKGQLCSGASQFAAGYVADWLSIDKRMSCSASDNALLILRAHYEMQINRDFTLIRDVGAPADEISERRRRAGPPTGDVGAPTDEIPERRRRAGPPTGDVRTTANEISERRRCAGPPAGDVGAIANEISERRRRAGPPTDSAGHL